MRYIQLTTFINRGRGVAAASLIVTMLAPYVTPPAAQAQAQSAASLRNSRGYLKEFTEIITKVLEADGEMWKQMKLVSLKLDQYYFRHGHFPRTSQEEATFKRILAKYIIANPYAPQQIDVANNEQLKSDAPFTIHFLMDAGLNPQSLKEWVKKPSPTWQADPGTIFVISNGENYYALWAASADRLPVRDFERNNKLKVIGHFCQQAPKPTALAGTEQTR